MTMVWQRILASPALIHLPPAPTGFAMRTAQGLFGVAPPSGQWAGVRPPAGRVGEPGLKVEEIHALCWLFLRHCA